MTRRSVVTVAAAILLAAASNASADRVRLRSGKTVNGLLMGAGRKIAHVECRRYGAAVSGGSDRDAQPGEHNSDPTRAVLFSVRPEARWLNSTTVVRR